MPNDRRLVTIHANVGSLAPLLDIHGKLVLFIHYCVERNPRTQWKTREGSGAILVEEAKGMFGWVSQP
jgi:hypothetical protein